MAASVGFSHIYRPTFCQESVTHWQQEALGQTSAAAAPAKTNQSRLEGSGGGGEMSQKPKTFQCAVLTREQNPATVTGRKTEAVSQVLIIPPCRWLNNKRLYLNLTARARISESRVCEELKIRRYTKAGKYCILLILCLSCHDEWNYALTLGRHLPRSKWGLSKI